MPATVHEALDMAAQHQGHCAFMAGGTDLMANRFQGNNAAPVLIDLTQVSDMKGIDQRDGYLRIGALETLHQLAKSPALSEFTMLREAAHSVGAPLLRKTATLGGNVLCENRCLYYNQTEWWRESIGYCLKCDGDICIATGGRNACFSELVSDTAPAIIAMEGEIEWVSPLGTRVQPLEAIYTGDGVKSKNLPDNAIVTAIRLPLYRNFRHSFHKLRERESLEYTSLTLAMAVDGQGNGKVAMSGVDPKAVVARWAAGALDKGALLKQLLKGARAVDNDMFTRGYRRQMVEVYLSQALGKVVW
jgi:4-hydroxybenzoyl-CoA reductase subunit beta